MLGFLCSGLRNFSQLSCCACSSLLRVKLKRACLIFLTFATYSTTLITPSFQTICRLEATGKEYRKKSALISSARGWPRYTELLLLDLCRNLRECLTRPTATRVQSPVTLPAGWSSSFPLWSRQLLTRPPNPAPPHGVPGLGNGLQWSVLAQDHCVCCPP